MVYRRSQEIENRLEALLGLIREGRYGTPALAKILNVSVPTISRCVMALRDRGHEIFAERHPGRGWCYVLKVPTQTSARVNEKIGRQPVKKAQGIHSHLATRGNPNDTRMLSMLLAPRESAKVHGQSHEFKTSPQQQVSSR